MQVIILILLVKVSAHLAMEDNIILLLDYLDVYIAPQETIARLVRHLAHHANLGHIALLLVQPALAAQLVNIALKLAQFLHLHAVPAQQEQCQS